jgi:hypothetical protein
MTWRVARLGLVLLATLAAVACSEKGDYLSVAGGGFMFNYRIAEASYGIALTPMRDLPADGVIEATLENPSGEAPFVMRKEGPFNPTRIAFQTPALQGVVKDHPYKVTVVLKDGAGEVLQTIEKSYASELDQTVLPERPLVVGPGYDRNVDGSTTSYPPSLSNPPAEGN